MGSRFLQVGVLLFAGALLALYLGDGLFGGYSREVRHLIALNADAKGGAETWRNVQTLKLSGRMDLGQGVSVPYTIEQKRPDKMCLRYEFDQRPAVQCVAGGEGWRFLPFMGHRAPERMTPEEAARMSDTASVDGILLGAQTQGFEVELDRTETIDGRQIKVLHVAMPGGTERWVYIDPATGLEVKLESTRLVGREEQRIETLYPDWREAEGLRVPARQQTRIVGGTESQFVTVEKVTVNEPIDDARFDMPAWGKPDTAATASPQVAGGT